LSDLSDEALAGLLAWMRERGRSVHTVRKEYDQLVAIWRFACQRHLVHNYPTIQRPGAPLRCPLAWTRAELVALFEAIDETPGWIEGCRACDWWRALHLMIWNSGERISAVLRLEWSHVDLRDGWLKIPAELRKNQTEDKLFKLAAYTLAALRKIEYPPRKLLFPWPLTKGYLWRRYTALLKRAGLPCGRGDKFHKLRRSVATFFEAAGGDATALLGHSARSVTQKHYLDARVIKPKQAADLLFRPDQNGKRGSA
jgi:integrase